MFNLRKNRRGGAGVLLMLLATVTIVGGSVFIIKSRNSGLKLIGTDFKKNSDQTKLQAYLSLKATELKKESNPAIAPFFCNTTQKFNNPEKIQNINFYLSCTTTNVDYSKEQYVTGNILTAYIDRSGKKSLIKKLFIPDFPSAGYTIFSSGDGVTRTPVSGPAQPQKVEAGVKVYQEDTVTTDSNSAARFRMVDDTIINLPSSSEFVFYKSTYDKNIDNRNFIFELVKGFLRAKVTHKSKSPTVKIKTRTVAIAVRGTEFYVGLSPACEDSNSLYCIMEIGNYSGEIELILLGATNKEVKVHAQDTTTEKVIIPVNKKIILAEIYYPSANKIIYSYKFEDLDSSSFTKMEPYGSTEDSFISSIDVTKATHKLFTDKYPSWTKLCNFIGESGVIQKAYDHTPTYTSSHFLGIGTVYVVNDDNIGFLASLHAQNFSDPFGCSNCTDCPTDTNPEYETFLECIENATPSLNVTGPSSATYMECNDICVSSCNTKIECIQTTVPSMALGIIPQPGDSIPGSYSEVPVKLGGTDPNSANYCEILCSDKCCSIRDGAINSSINTQCDVNKPSCLGTLTIDFSVWSDPNVCIQKCGLICSGGTTTCNTPTKVNECKTYCETNCQNIQTTLAPETSALDPGTSALDPGTSALDPGTSALDHESKTLEP